MCMVRMECRCHTLTIGVRLISFGHATPIRLQCRFLLERGQIFVSDDTGLSRVTRRKHAMILCGEVAENHWQNCQGHTSAACRAALQSELVDSRGEECPLRSDKADTLVLVRVAAGSTQLLVYRTTFLSSRVPAEPASERQPSNASNGNSPPVLGSCWGGASCAVSCGAAGVATGTSTATRIG